MPRHETHLLIIDPQNDFCDLPAAYCPIDPPSGKTRAPALPVPGAHADMQRLARLINTVQQEFGAITITLDSHHRFDIAHPMFWRQNDGAPVAPFTQISAADLRAGRYLPHLAQARARAQAYLDALERQGRHVHMIWPEHCKIGDWGNNIHDDLSLACDNWETGSLKPVNFVVKGSNPWTEHYSAMMAEVPDPEDAGSQFNTALFDALRAADRIYIAGEAGSHCVKATAEHLIERWPAAELFRLALIRDCVSPVSGFEAQYAAFLDMLGQRGVRILTAEDVAAELSSNS